MNVKELRTQAREMNIAGAWKMRKDQLIEAIAAATTVEEVESVEEVTEEVAVEEVVEVEKPVKPKKKIRWNEVHTLHWKIVDGRHEMHVEDNDGDFFYCKSFARTKTAIKNFERVLNDDTNTLEGLKLNGSDMDMDKVIDYLEN